jgi:D-alanine-D-alanine ligase
MSTITIGLVHNIPCTEKSCGTGVSSADVLKQIDVAERTLKSLGYNTRRIPFTRNIEALCTVLRKDKIDMVFNFCETVDEDAHRAGHPAALFELLNIPFSGSPSMAIMMTTDKIITKRLLKGRGIRTPDYLLYKGSQYFNTSLLKMPVILKPRYEDASIGIDQESVIEDENDLKNCLMRMYSRYGEIIVEEYVKGREFNISLFGYPSPRVMPIAEIDFSKFPAEMHRIVGYKAKWDENSFEYNNTPRLFDVDIDHFLLKEMERVAVECFNYFSLRDYGRIDIRLDNQKKIHVLEINANPCLSPDAGFPASLAHGHIDYREMFESFVQYMHCRLDNGNTKSPLERPE